MFYTNNLCILENKILEIIGIYIKLKEMPENSLFRQNSMKKEIQKILIFLKKLYIIVLRYKKE